jgi:hypothetical protein
MKTIRKYRVAVASCLGVVSALSFIAINLFADAPPPVLTISSLGSNQFLVTVTNSISTTNYTLFWTPILGDEIDYPWEAITNGTVGQSNFTVDAGGYSAGFFRVALLSGGGIPPWEAANPDDPNSPILTVAIISPADGSTVQ